MALDTSVSDGSKACRRSFWLGGGALRLRRPQRFGSAEVLREMIDADHLVAQLRGALQQRHVLAADDLRRERRLRELVGTHSANRAGLLRGADPGLHRLGLDRRGESGFEATQRLAFGFGQIYARAQAVADGRR